MNAHPQLGKFLEWLLNHSLQAGVLVVIVLAVQWLFRRQLTNRWRFALWWIVLGRLLLPFNPESALSLFNVFKPVVRLEAASAAVQSGPGAYNGDLHEFPTMENFPPPPSVVQNARPSDVAHPGPATPVSPRPRSFHNVLIPGLAGLWFAGVVVLCGVVITQLIRFRAKLARASSPSNPELQTLLDDCRREFGASRQIELLETDAVQSPVLFGLTRPCLLLPRGMGGQFAGPELRYIFLHEIAHVKRGDLWLNWLVTALQILHWFNPLLWLGFARLRADRELACDELALLRAGDNAGASYGETVVKLLENLSRPTAIPGLVGILEDKKQMRRRISMIVNFHKPSRWSALAVVLLAAIATTALTDAQTSKPNNPRLKVENDVTDISGMTSTGTSISHYDPYFVHGNSMPQVQVDVPGLHTNDLNLNLNKEWGKKYYNRPGTVMPDDLTGTNHASIAHVKIFSPGLTTLQSPPPTSTVIVPWIRLIPGEEVKGVVLSPNGKPAANAQVALQVEGYSLQLNNGVISSVLSFPNQQLARTRSDGSFTLPLYEGWQSVIAASDEGFAQVSLEQLELSPQITLQKWGRIEGTLRLGHLVATNEMVGLFPGATRNFSPGRSLYQPEPLWFGFDAYQSRTDNKGRFALAFVPPGSQNLCWEIPLDGGERQMNLLSQIKVEPGGTLVTNVGVIGRTVVGRLKLAGETPKDLTKSIGYLIGVPTGHQGRFPVFDIAADGTFRAEYIHPGIYNFRFEEYRHPLPDENHYLSVRGIIGFTRHEFQVPKQKNENDDSIVEVGTVELE